MLRRVSGSLYETRVDEMREHDEVVPTPDRSEAENTGMPIILLLRLTGHHDCTKLPLQLDFHYGIWLPIWLYPELGVWRSANYSRG
jgi:hypothetical protein